MGKSIKEIFEKLGNTKEEEKELKLLKQSTQDIIDEELYQKKKLFFENYSTLNTISNSSSAGGSKRTIISAIDLGVDIRKEEAIGSMTAPILTPNSVQVTESGGVSIVLFAKDDVPTVDLDFVTVDFDYIADVSDSNVTVGVGIDGDATYNIHNNGDVVEVTSQHMQGCLLITADQDARYPSVYIANLNGSDNQIDLSGIAFVVSKEPPALYGISKQFVSDLDNPDTTVEDANHTLSWESGKLKCVSTGSGTSYLLWNNINAEPQPSSQYLEVSGLTAPVTISICRESGTTHGLSRTTDGLSTIINTGVGSSHTAIGVKIVTTGSGDVYVDRFGTIREVNVII